MSAPLSFSLFVAMALGITLAAPPALAADGPGGIEGWGELIDPDGDCRVALKDGRLTISVPGTYHDLWQDPQGKMNAPRVLADAPDEDVTVTVKVVAPVVAEAGTEIRRGSAYRAAALVLWQDEKNYVRLDRGCLFRQGSVRHFCYLHVYRDGKRTVDLTETLRDIDKPVDLKLEAKRGNVTASFSPDSGTTWKSFPRKPARLGDKPKAGVAAINSSNKPFVAEFGSLRIEAPNAPGPQSK